MAKVIFALEGGSEGGGLGADGQSWRCSDPIDKVLLMNRLEREGVTRV